MITVEDDCEFYPVAEPNILAVCLHAYTLSPRRMQCIARVFREAYPQSDIYIPKLPFGLQSLANPNSVAMTILNYISALPSINKYDQIVLTGHSMGAVLARKVWALAHGATANAEVRADLARPWAGKISRIILLAATNRGWEVSSALEPLPRLGWKLGSVLANFLRHAFHVDPIIAHFRRGAAFLTSVRLQCLAVSNNIEKKPLIVQLIGTVDDLVAPTDNLDLATGRDFHYLEVSGATHTGIVDLNSGVGKTGALESFRLAIKGEEKAIAALALKPEDIFDVYDGSENDFDETNLPKLASDVKHVVFVVHGIRDRGFWTRRIARKVKELARESRVGCRAVTSTYGYFPMGPFLLPWVRDRKVEWLLDQYVTAKSLYPKAEFSYIGHSNGTYLVAKALQDCEAVKFDNIVFAGSVVVTNFEWSKLIPGQVTRVLNYVATDDRIVAVFPYIFERTRIQDLGGAGHRGFKDPAERKEDPAVRNFRRVVGGHGAALAEDRWEEMAKFVLKGSWPKIPEDEVALSNEARRAEKLAPLYWLLIVVGVLGIAGLILGIAGSPGWIAAIALVGYVYAVHAALTRA